MLKKVDKFWSCDFLGIKYEPLSDLPVSKICEWGPWVINRHKCLYTLSNALHVFMFFVWANFVTWNHSAVKVHYFAQPIWTKNTKYCIA